MRMNKTVQYYFAYQFIKYLVKDFRKWRAYEVGLIDEDGQKIRDPETNEEEETMAPFFNLIRKTKRLIAKAPGGRSLLGSVLAAGFLLKEEFDLDGVHIIESLFEEAKKQHLFEAEDCDNYLREEKMTPLTPGVYKNIDASTELYNGRHLFYIQEEVLPMPDIPGLHFFKIRNSLQHTIAISEEHLERIR